MIIDENKDCVTKSKLKIKVHTISKYNDKSRVAAKQTNIQNHRHRNWQTFRQKNIPKEQKNIQTDAQADLQWTHAHREVNK